MIGKVNEDLFCEAILPCQGAKLPEVVVGPQMGVDAAVLRLGDEYLVIAEDPIFPGPTMTADDFGWLTVHIGASDVAVMGVPPRYMTYSLLLPPGTEQGYIEQLVKSIDAHARALGIAIVGGHTGFYGAVTVPTIGGITVWGTGKSYLTPAGAQAGDDILITKGAAIEATALLANELAGTLAQKGVPADLIKRARHRLREVSVVQEAQLAVAVGGVHAMHDATEGGLERGLYEIARASGVGLRVERAKVLLPDDIRAVCECFALNPYQVISEGTLVLTCAPEKTEELLATFHAAGIDAAVIGAVMPAGQGMHWVEEDGQETVLAPPAVDRFWEVFFAALGPQEELCRELAQAVKTLQEAGIAALIPEIGANLAYGPENAQGTEEIAAIPGRLLRLRDEVVVLGEPELGCSTYMGGTLLAVQQHFPARCVINLRHNEKVRDACRELGFHMVSMPAPADFRQSDADFFRDLHATLAACRELPDVIEIPDRINLERLILVLGQTLPALVEKVVSLAERVP